MAVYLIVEPLVIGVGEDFDLRGSAGGFGEDAKRSGDRGPPLNV
jgi:hypothetical protein